MQALALRKTLSNALLERGDLSKEQVSSNLSTAFVLEAI